MFSFEDRIFIGGALIEIEDALGVSVTYLYKTERNIPKSYANDLPEETKIYREALNYFFNTFCPNFGLNEDNIEAFKNEYRSLDRYSLILERNSNFDITDIFGKPTLNS